MRFYIDGSTIGLSLDISGLLFLFYLLFEFISFYRTRLLFIQKIIIYFKIRKSLGKVLPTWWSVKRISLLSIHKYPDNSTIYAKASFIRRLNDGSEDINWDWGLPMRKELICCYMGLFKDIIISEKGVIEQLHQLDEDLTNEDKTRLKRNSLLDDLGI